MANQILRDPFLENLTKEYYIAEKKHTRKYYYKDCMQEISLDNPDNLNQWIKKFETELKQIRKTILNIK